MRHEGPKFISSVDHAHFCHWFFSLTQFYGTRAVPRRELLLTALQYNTVLVELWLRLHSQTSLTVSSDFLLDIFLSSASSFFPVASVEL